MRENRLVQRAPQHCCRRAGAEVLWVESSEGRLLVGNPHMAGTCLPKPVLLRISIARFVSESSHNGGRAHQNRRHRPLHPPVCEPILTRWGVRHARIGASPHLQHPLCERILAQRYPDHHESPSQGGRATHFVSQSSHDKGCTRQNQCPAHLRYPFCE